VAVSAAGGAAERTRVEDELVRGRIMLRAIKAIAPGHEITLDYGPEYFDLFLKVDGCKCTTCATKGDKKRRTQAERTKVVAFSHALRWVICTPLGRAVVPELMQSQMTGENLAREAHRLLADEPSRVEMKAGLAEVRQKLAGGSAAPQRAVSAIREILEGQVTHVS
jgi:hypothetical protein